MKFKIFFKSKKEDTTYNYPLEEREMDNVLDMVNVGNSVCKRHGLNINDLNVGLVNERCDYEREQSSTTGIFDTRKKYITKHT